MCLSTAYKIGHGEREKLAELIGKVEVDGNTVRLVDLMGAETTVKGRLAKIDLMENSILIEEA